MVASLDAATAAVVDDSFLVADALPTLDDLVVDRLDDVVFFFVPVVDVDVDVRVVVVDFFFFLLLELEPLSSLVAFLVEVFFLVDEDFFLVSSPIPSCKDVARFFLFRIRSNRSSS